MPSTISLRLFFFAIKPFFLCLIISVRPVSEDTTDGVLQAAASDKPIQMPLDDLV